MLFYILFGLFDSYSNEHHQQKLTTTSTEAVGLCGTSSSDDDVTDNEDNLADSSSDTDSSDSIDSLHDNGSQLSRDIYSAGDLVIVKFIAKKNILHYVAELLSHAEEGNNNEWTVKFLRKQLSTTSMKFVYPPVDQIYDVNVKDFVLKLPSPDIAATTKRHITFSGVDF